MRAKDQSRQMREQISADELAARIGTDREPTMVDVREPAEVAEWSIPGARNIPLGQLEARIDELPSEGPVVVVCASGNRSTTATDLLRGRGLEASNLTGGMAAWGKVYDTAELDVDGTHVVQVRRRGKGCLSYVIGSRDEAFVVDPGTDIDVYLQLASDRGWRIIKVFDTHLHADHLSGGRALAAATDASLHLNPNDAFGFDYQPLTDGERHVLPDGVELSVAVVHTPGHTTGSTMYQVGDGAVLTGDTLFINGVGRPDLADRAVEFATKLFHSLHERVLALPPDILVLPGHYDDDVEVRPGEPVAAPLGEVRRHLDALRLDEEAFIAWATERATPRPPSYVEIVKANMGSPELELEELRRLELGPNRCAAA